MFTNYIKNTEIKSAIIKADISDHFPILFVARVKVDVNIKTEQYILKRNISDQSIKKFKQKLRDVKWDDIELFDSVILMIGFFKFFFHYTMNVFQR